MSPVKQQIGQPYYQAFSAASRVCTPVLRAQCGHAVSLWGNEYRAGNTYINASKLDQATPVFKGTVMHRRSDNRILDLCEYCQDIHPSLCR